MNHGLAHVSKKYFKSAIEELSEREQHVVRKFDDHVPISYNTNESFESNMSFGQRIADKVASFGGSWTFILLFLSFMVVWAGLNSYVLSRQNAFDPYPYILLNLFLSMLASLQAPIILMSQNRQAEKDRLDAQHDYEVNLKAELEILSLHEKLDELRDAQWKELIQIQQQQIDMLMSIVRNNSSQNKN